MKWYLLILFLFISSCSSTSDIVRGPSSVANHEACLESIKPFFNSKSSLEMSKESLVENKLINKRDLSFLNSKAILDSLPEDQLEREQMEVGYLLLKKKFPQFSEEQIMSHYQLLKSYCGI